MGDRIVTSIAEKYKSIEAFWDERSKRIWAVGKARSLGRDGINAVRTAIGIATCLSNEVSKNWKIPPMDNVSENRRRYQQ